MNNPKSTALGWASLVAAAGVSYYFAKQSIDARRAQQAADGSRPTEKLDWRQRIEAGSGHPEGASGKLAFENAKAKTGNAYTEFSAKSTPLHAEDDTPAVMGNGVRETK